MASVEYPVHETAVLLQGLEPWEPGQVLSYRRDDDGWAFALLLTSRAIPHCSSPQCHWRDVGETVMPTVAFSSTFVPGSSAPRLLHYRSRFRSIVVRAKAAITNRSCSVTASTA